MILYFFSTVFLACRRGFFFFFVDIVMCTYCFLHEFPSRFFSHHEKFGA
jgi:hypothetical protein